MTLHERIIEAIGGQPVTQVARAAHLSLSQMWLIRSGNQKRGPGLDTIVALAAATNVCPAWLAFGVGDKHQASP